MRPSASWSLLLFNQAAASVLPSRQEPAKEPAAGTQEYVELKFADGCPSDRRTDISNAWNDAITIFRNLPATIDFNEPAAIDFFGTPQNNQPKQDVIQRVLNHAKTFSEKYWFDPWTRVPVYIDCNENREQELGHPNCRKNGAVKAVTWNTRGDGREYNGPDARFNMYICNSFWKTRTLDEVINEYKDAKDEWKYNVQVYMSRASIIAHEMIHGDVVAYRAAYMKHIPDLKMKVKIDGVEKSMDVYGAEANKIMARTDWSKIGLFTAGNADTYSFYALAKYVEGKLGKYPWLPIVTHSAMKGKIKPRSEAWVAIDGDNWSLKSSPFQESLKSYGDDRTWIIDSGISAAQEGEENNPPALEGLKWYGDDQYPDEYIKQRNEFLVKTGLATDEASAPAPKPTGPKEGVECIGLDSKRYMSVNTLQGNIVEFCKLAVAQGLQDKDSGAIYRKFNEGTLDEVALSVDWPPGFQAPFDEAECVKQLTRVHNDCDQKPENPMHYKGGGTAYVAHAVPLFQVKYNVWPAHDRQALPNGPAAGCDVQWTPAVNLFWVWGNGFATSDWGQRGGGLLEEIKSCAGSLTEWKFDYGLGSDGREWSAQGKTLIGKRWCIERAIANAGGPSIGCSGDR